MPGRTQRVDVVVVGAGTAGANAAGQLAARGRSVALVDRRPAEAAGAQWHNGVLPWQFAAAQVEPPVPVDGSAAAPRTAHFFGPDGRHSATVTDSPVVRADMAGLGRRLRTRAVEAGVEILDSSDVLDVETDWAGRLCAIEIGRSHGDGPGRRLRLEAALFVDASGRHGALRGAAPALTPWCPDVRDEELCSAGDHEFRVGDRNGARRFLTRHGAEAGQAVTILGPAGGWSTRAVTVANDLRSAAVLVGCLASGPRRTAPHLQASARADLPWLGEVLSGAFGVIPLRRPFARFTAPGLALVGDAACQVFPAHGSGIGLGLMAGTMLAEGVADADDCGDESVLWGYQYEYQRSYGGTLAAFESLRRMSTELGTSGVRDMIRAGLMDAEAMRAGLEQRWRPPSPASVPAAALRLASVPSAAATMVPRMVRARALSAVGAKHPAGVDLAALERWDAKVRRLLGTLPRPSARPEQPSRRLR
ncbi:MAG: FAD-dependent oxidoreductase [Microthrixaceae bacterium]